MRHPPGASLLHSLLQGPAETARAPALSLDCPLELCLLDGPALAQGALQGFDFAIQILLRHGCVAAARAGRAKHPRRVERAPDARPVAAKTVAITLLPASLAVVDSLCTVGVRWFQLLRRAGRRGASLHLDRGERPGDALQGSSLGSDPEQQLRDSSERHGGGTDEEACGHLVRASAVDEVAEDHTAFIAFFGYYSHLSVMARSAPNHQQPSVDAVDRAMLELLAQLSALRPLPLPEPGQPAHDLDYLTNFERKFRKEGKPIHRGAWERSSPAPAQGP